MINLALSRVSSGGVTTGAVAVTSSVKDLELSPALFFAVTVTVYEPTGRLPGTFTVRVAVFTEKPLTAVPFAFLAATVTAMGSVPVRVYTVSNAVPSFTLKTACRIVSSGGVTTGAVAVTSSVKDLELSPALFLAVTVTVYEPTGRLPGAFTVWEAVFTEKLFTAVPFAFLAATATVMGSVPVRVYATSNAEPCLMEKLVPDSVISGGVIS
jgi:hypothetical protein